MVVGVHAAGRQACLPCVDVDGGELALDELDVVAARELVQVEWWWGAEPEGGGHGSGAMLQSVGGREKVDFEIAARQVTQRQDRLHGGHSGARDEDAL
jgi:hypothetical protein